MKKQLEIVIKKNERQSFHKDARKDRRNYPRFGISDSANIPAVSKKRIVGGRVCCGYS